MRVVKLLALAAVFCAGLIVGRATASEEVVEEIVELTIVVPSPGRYGYSDQMSIMYACVVEMTARWWNIRPESRPWLKKYIEAFAADSTFRISEKQKIRFKED